MPKALLKGRMSQGLTYTYSLFHRLSRYHLDRQYQMGSNLVENVTVRRYVALAQSRGMDSNLVENVTRHLALG